MTPDHDNIDATYSPEDNKLRLYCVYRLDDETYEAVKKQGFKWAPKQELFVAPSWSPAREDFCIELAGTIEPEETTLVERAEAKAERLDNLSEKREHESNAFFNAAHSISERFAHGQPILVGHHSERRARKDAEQMERAQEKAVLASQAANYWKYRAEGVERHANRKVDPGVRYRRIKTLLAELRDKQRQVNHGHIVVKLWDTIICESDREAFEKAVEHYAGARLATGETLPWKVYQEFSSGKLDHAIVARQGLAYGKYITQSPYYPRWISHLLNRLGYERSELGPVSVYQGELTKAVLQEFARNQGTHKPVAKCIDGDWEITSSVPLPAHLSPNEYLTLDDDGWRELMANVGYEVPAPKPKAPPILNFECATIDVNIWNDTRTLYQIKMTKAEYSKIYKDERGCRPSACGQFKVKIAKDPSYDGPGYSAPFCVVFLTDSKVHPAPASPAIKFEADAA